jgi:hypothetical protein
MWKIRVSMAAGWVVLLAAVALGATKTEEQDAGASAKKLLALPSAEAQATAEKAVAATYAKQLAACGTDADKKSRLAGAMIEDAGKATDPAVRYVALTKALRLAAEAEAPDVAVAALRAIAASYDLGGETVKQCLANGQKAWKASMNQRTYKTALEQRLKAAYWLVRAEAIIPEVDLDMKAKVAELLRQIETGENMPPTPDRNELVVWNTHNFTYKSSGSATVSVFLLSENKVIWQKTNIDLGWDAQKNIPTKIKLPATKYDKVKLILTPRMPGIVGLAEVEVYRNGRNIALGRPVRANAEYGRNLCTPEMAVDGINFDKSDGGGYWMSPVDGKKPGWIEINVGASR